MKDLILDELAIFLKAMYVPVQVTLGLVTYHYFKSFGYFVGWAFADFVISYLKAKKQFYG